MRARNVNDALGQAQIVGEPQHGLRVPTRSACSVSHHPASALRPRRLGVLAGRRHERLTVGEPAGSVASTASQAARFHAIGRYGMNAARPPGHRRPEDAVPHGRCRQSRLTPPTLGDIAPASGPIGDRSPWSRAISRNGSGDACSTGDPRNLSRQLTCRVRCGRRGASYTPRHAGRRLARLVVAAVDDRRRCGRRSSPPRCSSAADRARRVVGEDGCPVALVLGRVVDRAVRCHHPVIGVFRRRCLRRRVHRRRRPGRRRPPSGSAGFGTVGLCCQLWRQPVSG